MGTARGMLKAMADLIGESGRPNKVTHWYAGKHGAQFLTEPWCDMAISYAAHKSGNEGPVLIKGDRAYTVWHAQDFQHAGRWHSGTRANVDQARPGDIVFFDWGLSDSIENIDHVGIVVKALGGGMVETIEGNTGDACKQLTRNHSVIAGYGRPNYDTQQQEDQLRTLVDLGAFTPQTIKANTRGSLEFEHEYADPDKVHTDASADTRYPSIFPKGPRAPYVVRLAIELAQPCGPGVSAVWAEYERNTNELAGDHSPHELQFQAVDQVVTWVEMAGEGGKYRIDIKNEGDEDLVIARAFLLVAR